LALFSRTLHSSTQLPICFSVLLLSVFVVLSEAISLEAVLRAFSAGMIVGLGSRGESGNLFREKMDAIGFGVFVPFFFVVSGMNLDVGALAHSPEVMAFRYFWAASLLCAARRCSCTGGTWPQRSDGLSYFTLRLPFQWSLQSPRLVSERAV
jgi:Kef-type K+ transport system membrane component KefB